ncbi:MAG TPA: superoxide dismutase, partial [Patescibacteria group bacterium]|nr:superoxide dismutase [Patescibacteria group bacterium]
MNKTLPKLNYNYDSLEPFIDAKTVEIHYSKHHQNYLNKLVEA